MFHVFLNLSSFAARFAGYAAAFGITYQGGEHLYPCYGLVLAGEAIHAVAAVAAWQALRATGGEPEAPPGDSERRER